MYKEIQIQDIVNVLEKEKIAYLSTLTETIGEENVSKLAEKLEVIAEIYKCPFNCEFIKDSKWNEVALFSHEGKAYIASHSLHGVYTALKFINKLVLDAYSDGRDLISVLDFAEPFKLETEGYPKLPDYEGGRILGSFNHEDGNYGYIITGTADVQFDNFVEKVKSEGFTEKKRSDIAGNTYVYLADGKGQMIYTYYSPMARRATVIGGRDTYSEIYCEGDKEICPLTLWQGHPSAFKGGMGHSYLMRLADSSFFVIDGGRNDNNEAENLLAELVRENVRPDGKIIIRCWFISHAHSDHYNSMREFIASKSDKVTVEKIAFSYTHADYRKYSDTPNHWDIREGCRGFAGCKYVKPQAGQTWRLPGCEIEILFTAEDMFNNPFYVKSLNSASDVIRIRAAGQTIIFPGDIEADTADIICASFGNYLRCDIMQIAHHGFHGASDEFYTLAQPKVILYPIMFPYDQKWDDVDRGNYVWRRLPCVEEVIPSHIGNTMLELPYYPKKQ